MSELFMENVNYGSCTSFHLAEALNEKMPRKKMGTAIIENNKRVWKWFEDYAYDSDEDFEQIGKAFEETSNVLLGEIGNAECRLFNMKTGVDFAGEWLEKNRFNA